MSDSFADLWASSAPKPSPTLGSASPTANNKSTPYTNAQAGKKYDAFSILSNPSSSSSTSSLLSGARTATPNRQPSPAVAPSKSVGGGGDAFASLAFGNIGNDAKNMTIAERAKKAEQDRLNSQLRSSSAAAASAKGDSGAWAGLDMLGSTAVKPSTTSSAVDDDWGFGSISAVPSSSSNAQKASVLSGNKVDQNDDWGLEDFASPSPARTPVEKPKATVPQQRQSQKKMGIWDLDDFAEPSSSTTSARTKTTNDTNPKPNDTPDFDFDFGNREDRDDLGNGYGSDGDDILGELAKPAGSLRATPSPQPQLQHTPKPSSQSQSRAASPPPHVIGAIVEMGFTPQQARVALAATESGTDVQAALDILLSQSETDRPAPPRRRETSPPPPPHPSRRTSNNTNGRRAGAAPRSTPDEDGGDGQAKFQADKLVAQASEIGMNVFSKANAFWNMGKEKVQKAYEEYNADREREKRVDDGRPRWMRDAEEGSERDGERRAAPRTRPKRDVDDGWGDAPSGSGFRDDDNDEVVLPKRPTAAPAAAPPPKTNKEPEVDLFSRNSTGSGAYVSKFRHGRPKPSPSTTATSSSSSRQPTQAPPPPIPAKPKRPEISATSAQLATSEQHASRGSSLLAAGSYGDAETALSRAIDALPEKHLALAPLFNDRALARLKNGDANGAVADATSVLEVIGEDIDVVVKKEKEYVIVAWKRRAEAFEAREKWDEARKDWERIAGCSWAGERERGEGVRGVGRCRDALMPKPKPKPKPARPTPPATRRGPSPPSKAVEEFRKANAAAEAEAEQKHALKDTVDAKLIAWKGGKETNVRALLASLDSVLWPELGWESVGMKDLITDKQVKIKYMKAIARVHPDKLNAGNTKLEHRMIANGVFGALNEAWNATQT